MAEEVKVTSLESGDVVQIESGVETVRAVIETGYPSRILLLFESGGSISFAKPDLVTRLRDGQGSSPYRSPKWICGMPNKTKVRDLKPGDVLLELDWQTVRAVLRTATDERVLVTEAEMGSQVAVRVASELTEFRVVARGNAFGTWHGTVPANVGPESVSPRDLRVGDQVVVSDQLATVSNVGASNRGSVEIEFQDGNRVVWNIADFVVRFVEIEVVEVVEPSVIELPIAVKQSPTPDANVPSVARFCGQCGRERRPGASFCTGCGTRFSTISTVGFEV